MEVNRPLPSSKNPHFQNEARCTTFLVKMSFICMRMKNDFHIKGWAPSLVLKQRSGENRKWPIVQGNPSTRATRNLRASSPIWASEASRARTRERGASARCGCNRLPMAFASTWVLNSSLTCPQSAIWPIRSWYQNLLIMNGRHQNKVYRLPRLFFFSPRPRSSIFFFDPLHLEACSQSSKRWNSPAQRLIYMTKNLSFAFQTWFRSPRIQFHGNATF